MIKEVQEPCTFQIFYVVVKICNIEINRIALWTHIVAAYGTLLIGTCIQFTALREDENVHKYKCFTWITIT